MEERQDGEEKVYVSIYGMPEWDEVLKGWDVQSNPEFDLDNLVHIEAEYSGKIWGLRKVHE